MSSRKELPMRSSSAFAALIALAFAAAFLWCATAYAQTDDTSYAQLTTAATDTVKTVAKYGTNSANTTGSANIRTVYRFGWISGGNNNYKEAKTTNLDVTGDGWADTIKVTGTRTSQNSGYLRKIKVTVNGDTAYSYSNSSNKINRAVVSVVTLKNKQPYLWVNLLDGKGNGVQTLFKYEGGSFVKMLSNKALNKKNTSNCIITNLEPENNKVVVTFGLFTTVTGMTKIKYTYEYDDGDLTRTSNTTTNVRYATTATGGYTQNNLTAAGTFKAYKTTSLKKKAFTVKADKKVSIVSVQVKGSRLLYKVKYNGKSGWIACPTIKKKSSRAPATLFYEVYGKLKLKSSIPTYSEYKAFTVEQLEQYNDHALYVARNEIFARNGYKFTNGELANRFKGSKYPNFRYPLTRTEQANVDLILAIERNRGSLYAV